MSKLIRAAERRISEHKITYLLLWTGNRANLSMRRKCKEPQGEKMSSISDQHALQRKIKLVSTYTACVAVVCKLKTDSSG